MSPEAQRIAIGKACGLHLHDGDHAASRYMFVSDLPDYLNDLNAMHDAEEALRESDRIELSNHFYDIACEYQKQTGKWRYLSLTAAQRAEAFLRTLSLWEP